MEEVGWTGWLSSIEVSEQTDRGCGVNLTLNMRHS